MKSPRVTRRTLGFQKKGTAERFLNEMRERLAKFGLTLHPDKTRLIEFGRFAEENRRERGQGRPETFDFLGYVFSPLMLPRAIF